MNALNRGLAAFLVFLIPGVWYLISSNPIIVDEQKKNGWTEKGKIEKSNKHYIKIFNRHQDGDLYIKKYIYYEDGMLQHIEFTRKPSNEKTTRPNGIRISFQKNGIPIYFESYNNVGEKNGTQLKFYKNGVLKSQKQYSQGKLNGRVILYTQNGIAIEEGHYLNGNKHGKQLTYYPNGKIRTKVEYQKNQPEGPWHQYYEDGSVMLKGVMKNGQNIGMIAHYKKDGSILKEFTVQSL